MAKAVDILCRLMRNGNGGARMFHPRDASAADVRTDVLDAQCTSDREWAKRRGSVPVAKISVAFLVEDDAHDNPGFVFVVETCYRLRIVSRLVVPHDKRQ